tara:strand:+ start:23 stop:421 length:399 start_codon:yes stop_codon:yes gene_type:complete
MRVLILHGPNMNLFGIRSAKKKQTVTLDKINRHIRRFIRDKNLEIKIIQTNSETKAVSYIQKNRNKFNGIIITPGPWDEAGYILLDLLELINMNYTIINIESKKNNLFKDSKIIYHTDILKSFEEAINQYVS